MAEQEDSPGIQAVVEQLDGGLSGSSIEVDEDVTTENGVGAPEYARTVLV